jgi:hypothetical protein
MDHIYRSIPGWCNFEGLYRSQVDKAKDGAHFVETGVYLGKSTSYMAVEIANSGKRIQFDAYDTFEGVPEEFWKGDLPALDFVFEDQERLRDSDGLLVTAASGNLEPVKDHVTLFRADGVHAAGYHEDESLDFVFLDDDHTTLHLLNELEAWWPKVKPGGTLAGHDYNWKSVAKAVKTWGTRVGRAVQPEGASSWSVQKPVAADTWLVPPRNRKCLVAVCCNERNIHRHTVESLIKLGWGQRVLDAAEQYQFQTIDFMWSSRYLSVADLRDEVVMAALAGEYSHILFLDADMKWESDILSRMLAHHGHGIVTGLYHLKAWPHWPVALKGATWNAIDGDYDYTYDEAAPHSEMLRREELVGMGCTIVPVEVFRRYERPWFKYGTNAEGMTVITEDVYFSQQAIKAGCPMWLDPTVKCGHISQEIVTSAHYDRSIFEMAMLSNGQRMELQTKQQELVKA